MKKTIIIMVAILISLRSFAQTDSIKCKLKPYASIGISIGHMDQNDESINKFSKASFPSLELGLMGDNICLGAVVGYENILATSATRMFYELKTSVFKSLSKTCSAYALFGVGAYGETGIHNFIEYGAGFTYMPNTFGYFVQYSNWARSNYVSVGLTKTF